MSGRRRQGWFQPAGAARPASGMSAQPVKLPKAGDYTRPPLRKKVMESLNELPRFTEDIEDYLKNVAK